MSIEVLHVSGSARNQATKTSQEPACGTAKCSATADTVPRQQFLQQVRPWTFRGVDLTRKASATAIIVNVTAWYMASDGICGRWKNVMRASTGSMSSGAMEIMKRACTAAGPSAPEPQRACDPKEQGDHERKVDVDALLRELGLCHSADSGSSEQYAWGNEAEANGRRRSARDPAHDRVAADHEQRLRK